MDVADLEAEKLEGILEGDEDDDDDDVPSTP